MKKPGNERLFAARVAKGWFSQERAAHGVSQAGQEVLRDTGFEVSVRTYRRWESPKPSWPRPEYATALRAAFGRGPEHLGFAPHGGFVGEVDTDEAAGAIMPPVNRREALAVGAAVLGLPWLSPTTTAPTGSDLRIGSDEIEMLRETALDLDAIDQRFGGDRLWRSARAHLMWVHHLINHGTYSDEVGLELHGLAGQLTTSLGWFCYDAERQTEARVYFSEALNTAILAGDGPLATRTLSNMARQSVDIGKPREAVQFARLAREQAAGWSAPPRVTALLSIREAQGYARAGNEMAASAAIRRAWTAFGRGVDHRDPDWVAFLNEAELTCLEGMCRADLGQHKRAVRLLERSAALQDVDHSRNRGMCLARLSHAAIQDRDVDRTVHAARESLRLIEGGMTSTRNVRQLALVRDGLQAHRGHREARETADLLAAYIA